MAFAATEQAKGEEIYSGSVFLFVFPAFVKQFAMWRCQNYGRMMA